ncbi:MAG: cobalamin biosynthesis protein [Arcobacter sp.]|nr:cobalamin biosynthesis protein [Arcobacter sp.]
MYKLETSSFEIFSFISLKIEESFLCFLSKYNLQKEQIENIASFEAKEDEKGLLKFASKYGFDIKFYNKTQINKLEGEFSPS